MSDYTGSAENDAEFPEQPTRELAEARKDTSRLDWAESHPEKFYELVGNWWANAGRGFREVHFNWRGLIDGAMKESKP